MFEAPHFTFWNLLYTALGAALFWGRWGQKRLKAFVLSDILALIPLSEKQRVAVELLIFIVIGALIGVGVAKPINIPQAISAGMGWTGLLGKLDKTR